MTRDELIALAQKTDLWRMLETYSGEFGDGNTEADCLPELMAFVALIEKHLTYGSIHSCHPGCTKPACAAMREAAKAERKRICDMLLDMHAKEERHNYYGFIARMIKESA